MMTLFEKSTVGLGILSTLAAAVGWQVKKSKNTATTQTEIQHLKQDVEEIKKDVDEVKTQFNEEIRQIRSDTRKDVGGIHAKLDALIMGLANRGMIASTTKTTE